MNKRNDYYQRNGNQSNGINNTQKQTNERGARDNFERPSRDSSERVNRESSVRASRDRSSNREETQNKNSLPHRENNQSRENNASRDSSHVRDNTHTKDSIQNRDNINNRNLRRDNIQRQGYSSYQSSQPRYNNRIKSVETADEIKSDIARIEKEIELEIKEIKSMRLGL